MNPQLGLPITLGSIVTTSTSNNALYYPGVPMQVIRVGFVVTVPPQTTAPVIEFNLLKASGGAVSPSGSQAFGTLTATSATMAADTGVWADVAAVKGTRIAYPGEVIQAKVATASSTTGTVIVFMLVEPVAGFTNADLRSTYTNHPGVTTNPTALASWTKVTA